ncbi:MAG: hypothetical protein ACJAVO_001889 [Parvibaculaceae bacterium]|jgi:hypothetical protein
MYLGRGYSGLAGSLSLRADYISTVGQAVGRIIGFENS